MKKESGIKKLAHIWFDVDNTLYRMNAELEARIFNAMYDCVAQHKRMGVEKVQQIYDPLFERLESHTRVFENLGISADEARVAYNIPRVADHVRPDVKLIQLFFYLTRKRVPFSLYSNNYSQTIDSVLAKLRLEKNPQTRFAYKLSGESYSKSSGSGFRRILEMSRTHARNPSLPAGRLLFVGDREKMDIIPAKKAGMMTARVLWNDKTESVPSVADYKLANIYELKSVVDSLVR